jgi:hypothetical protein
MKKKIIGGLMSCMLVFMLLGGCGLYEEKNITH